MKKYNIETEFKFKITREQFRQALKEKRIGILSMQLIRQMWLFNNVHNNNNNTIENTIPFKSRIRSITDMREIHNPTGNSEHTSNTTEYSHCVKYPLCEGDESSSIECEQLISEEEFLTLRKLGSLKGRTITEKLRYSLKFTKQSELEELLRLWIVTVDIYDDREDVNVELELMRGLISKGDKIRIEEEIEKMRGLVERIREYMIGIGGN